MDIEKTSELVVPPPVPPQKKSPRKVPLVVAGVATTAILAVSQVQPISPQNQIPEITFSDSILTNIPDTDIITYTKEGNFWPCLSVQDREHFLQRARQISAITPTDLAQLERKNEVENTRQRLNRLSSELRKTWVGRKVLVFAREFEQKRILRESLKNSKTKINLFKSPRLESMSNEEVLSWIQKGDLLSSLNSQEAGYMSHRIIQIPYFQDLANFREYQKILATLLATSAQAAPPTDTFEAMSARIKAEAMWVAEPTKSTETFEEISARIKAEAEAKVPTEPEKTLKQNPQ